VSNSHATRQRLSDPFFLEMLGALADELTARGYNLLLSKITQPPTDWIAGLIKTKRADGVIVIGQSLHHEELNEAASSDIGMVVWGSRLKGQRYVTVGSDNEGGAFHATWHLIEQGCSRIVFLGDPAVPEVRARIEGHLRALASAGISRTASLEVAVRFGSDAAYDGVSSLLDAHAQFDGVFACSDVIAMSAMRALTERGRRVPGDVAVVGFDDVPLATYTTPPLTTVRQDCTAGARILVENLLQLMAGEHVESEVIPTELVVRASSLRQHHQHAGPRRLNRSQLPEPTSRSRHK
jgi:DNA-binding LacI/PurR family transcriptional regulator